MDRTACWETGRSLSVLPLAAIAWPVPSFLARGLNLPNGRQIRRMIRCADGEASTKTTSGSRPGVSDGPPSS
jgi:hypothetical protein